MANESKPRRASVSILPTQPNQPTMSTQQAFAAQHASTMMQDTTTVTSENVTGQATHTRPGTVVMYKPSQRAGWVARTVSSSAIPTLLYEGWREYCPECNDHHVDRNGNITTDPNACKGREAVSVRVCPVCRKRVYDNMNVTRAMLETEDDDPNVIADDSYGSSDAATRTKQKMDLHLWVRHPEWAQANGVPPLPTAFREMVETPLQRGT